MFHEQDAGALAAWPHDRNERDATIDLRAGDDRLRFTIHRNGEYACSMIDGAGAATPHRERGGNTTSLPERSGFVQPLLDLYNSAYIPSLRSPLSPGQGGTFYDTEFGQTFIATWDRLKRGRDKGENELVDKVEDDVAHLLGIQRLEINAQQQNNELRLMIDKKAYSLHDVGSGMANAILCLATVAIRKTWHGSVCARNLARFVNAWLATATLFKGARRIGGRMTESNAWGLAPGCGTASSLFLARRVGHHHDAL